MNELSATLKEKEKLVAVGVCINIIFFSLLDSDWLKSVPINP